MLRALLARAHGCCDVCSLGCLLVEYKRAKQSNACQALLTITQLVAFASLHACSSLGLLKVCDTARAIVMLNHASLLRSCAEADVPRPVHLAAQRWGGGFKVGGLPEVTSTAPRPCQQPLQHRARQICHAMASNSAHAPCWPRVSVKRIVVYAFVCMQICIGMCGGWTAGAGCAFGRLCVAQCAGSCLLSACVLMQHLRKSGRTCVKFMQVLVPQCSMRRRVHLMRS